MRKLNIIIFILIVLAVLSASLAVYADEPQRRITNCIYGDSLEKDVCDKFKYDANPTPQGTPSVPTPAQTPYIGAGK